MRLILYFTISWFQSNPPKFTLAQPMWHITGWSIFTYKFNLNCNSSTIYHQVNVKSTAVYHKLKSVFFLISCQHLSHVSSSTLMWVGGTMVQYQDHTFKKGQQSLRIRDTGVSTLGGYQCTLPQEGGGSRVLQRSVPGPIKIWSTRVKGLNT